MLWEEYYEKLEDWATGTAVSRMSQLASFGPPEEIVDAIIIIGSGDEKGATRLLKKATAGGVKFTGEQLSELCLICGEEALKQAIRFSSDRFTAEDLEALYCSCDDGLLIEIAKKQGIPLPEDLAEWEESEEEECASQLSGITAQSRHKKCPNCGKSADSHFCPDCGMDLRSPVIPASASGIHTKDYASYRRFYPNKIEAIQALRTDTGMGAVEAKNIIDKLFGADVMPQKPEFRHPTRWNAVSSAANDRDPDFIEVDVAYYANQYYPDKAQAIGALLRLGVGGADARRAMDDAFQEIQNSKEADRQKKAQAAVKAMGKGAGFAQCH